MAFLRNIAIIAHVDHGKTTLIDSLLSQTGTFRANEQVQERVMDSNDLEKERGITILAKCTAISWEDYKINIIDTPGHADFGGEVERVLCMADGVVLLVDAAEGPMPQTKFVLSKALKQNLRPIVVINKADRSDSRVDGVLDEIFDLFVSLDATEEQLDFPVLYASGRSGWCVEDLEKDSRESLIPLLKLITSHVPEPQITRNSEEFSMLVTLLESDSYLGRILTGRVISGVAKVNMPVKALSLEGTLIENSRLTKLRGFSGVKRVEIEEAQAGDIISIAGMAEASVADTICDISIDTPIQSTPIDPPTMSITISVNDSPFAGREGTKVTSRVIRERLLAEAESNVAITITESNSKDSFEVGGRGELQLGVLIETMRREGFELSVSRPKVIFQEENGVTFEPIEEVTIDVDNEYQGIVVEKLSLRKGVMTDLRESGDNRVRMIFTIPSRGLIGYGGQFLTDTRGSGILNRIYFNHEEHRGDIEFKKKGALISMTDGEAVGYALFNLQDRGVMFVKPQDKIYIGMIVGENSRDNDLEINLTKGKQLTNVRASGTDKAIKLVPPKILTLEDMISYIDEDELVEVTPKNLRLRKKLLDPNERKKAGKKG